MQRRRLAADVLAQDVDLVGRHVQPVVALVGHEEVVPLDAADRPLDHALVPADAVLDVDDVHAGLEVLEDAEGIAAPARAAMGPAAAGEVALGDDRQLGRRQRDAVVERGDDDSPAGRVRSPRRLVDPSSTIGRSRPWSRSSAASRAADPSPSAATTTR